MRKNHPYVDNPEYSFWDRAISDQAVGEINPSLGMTSFHLASSDAVMTMGSCFAQHVSQRLSKVGLNFLVTENQPDNRLLNSEGSYGVFTARYGNIYTITQAVQLIKRCLGEFSGGDIWTYKNSFVDSYRPRAIPGGFDSEDSLISDRQGHLNATLRGFQTAQVLVFTLGLTEGWKNIETGQIYAIAPGVAGGEFNDTLHQAFNMSMTECISELNALVALLRYINPLLKIILTVSPVPLAATHTGKHVLTATFSSKAKLRVAAEEISQTNENVDYFPSFEIIQGLAQSGRYYKSDLHEVETRGVDHVMRVFFDHYYDDFKISDSAILFGSSRQEITNAEILCDDEIFLGTNEQ